jgi:hypothetical protein
MARAVKRDEAGDTSERQKRDQEVLRANKELAAYFKGRRTEREARAALKIVKAFIRDRERMDPGSLRPLPGVEPATPPKPTKTRTTTRKIRAVHRAPGRKPRLQVRDTPLEALHSVEIDAPTSETPESDETT